MKKVTIFCFGLLLASAALAQNPTPAHSNNGNIAISSQLPKDMPFVSVTAQEFEKQINSKKVVVVDVRSEKEYNEGHLKDAVLVTWDEVFKDRVIKANLDKKKTVAVYCRSGRRSKMAADALVGMGYKVIELDKGIVDWQKAGFEIVK